MWPVRVVGFSGRIPRPGGGDPYPSRSRIPDAFGPVLGASERPGHLDRRITDGPGGHGGLTASRHLRESAPPVPHHVGIIMDGNGRWARARRRSVSYGHRAGVAAIKRTMYACEELGVKILSVYAFSTENWRRSRREVGGLMRLFEETLQREFDELNARGVRIVVSGRREGLSGRMQRQITEAEEGTRLNREGVLNVCLNYGGRAELVDAVKRLVIEGVSVDGITEEAISTRLYRPELPDPDLIIRTAAETRLSNFLLWESAYSEFYVTPTLWPDFDRAALAEAIAEYQRRIRRFGARPAEPERAAG